MSTQKVSFTFGFCDLCNVAGLEQFKKEGADFNEIVRALKGKPPPPGVFYGDAEAMAAAGWQERDFGQICPPCAKKEHEQDLLDEEQGAQSFFMAPSALALQAAQADLDKQNAAAGATGQKENVEH